MVKAFTFAVLASTFLSTLASAQALKYEEAAWRCSTGDLEACEVMYVYDMARTGKSGHQ